MTNGTDEACGLDAAIAAMRRRGEGAWWVVRVVALALGTALAVCVLKLWSWTFWMVMADVVVYGSAVGLASLFLHMYELAARRRLAQALAEGKPLLVRQPWAETLLAVATIAAGGWFVASGAQWVKRSERQEAALRDEARLQRLADHVNTGGVVVSKLNLSNPSERDLANLRVAVDNALRANGYATRLGGAPGASTADPAPAAETAAKPVAVVGPVKGSPGEWRVEVAYTEPLYAVGEARTRKTDPETGLSYALSGGAFRVIREVAPAGTPVPSRLRVLANGNIDLQAEGVENPTFPSGFARRFGDAALVVEGSEAHRTLEHILDRALLVARQLQADGKARRTDRVAAARYERNLRLLDKDLPRAVAAALNAHAGKILGTLPESWAGDFGAIASEQTRANAAIDTAALMKDVNRRLSIAATSSSPPPRPKDSPSTSSPQREVWKLRGLEAWRSPGGPSPSRRPRRRWSPKCAVPAILLALPRLPAAKPPSRRGVGQRPTRKAKPPSLQASKLPRAAATPPSKTSPTASTTTANSAPRPSRNTCGARDGTSPPRATASSSPPPAGPRPSPSSPRAASNPRTPRCRPSSRPTTS